MTTQPRYLLIQIRDSFDRVKQQEINCFARALDVTADDIELFDLLNEPLTPDRYASFDMVMIGGSGKYSVTSEADWLYRALEGLQQLVASGKPTFASCWGFQAIARATGGVVRHDLAHAELGSLPVRRTAAGREDPLFSALPDTFLAYMGHEDRVVELPPGTVHLAESDTVAAQAYRFVDKPIYCTQFHPELTLETLLDRIAAYPEYCERIARIPFSEFRLSCQGAPESETLLRKFKHHFVNDRI